MQPLAALFTMNKTFYCLIIFFTSLLLLGCNTAERNEKKIIMHGIQDVSIEQWEKLSQKKIFFGHQSVGYNIMDGVASLAREYHQLARLNIAETATPNDLSTAFFAHYRVGENRNPKSKNNDFRQLLDGGLGSKVDWAFLKYCYVDITASTNVDKVFEDYQATFAALEEKYPAIKFIHITIPLKSIAPGGFTAKSKELIKNILGRATGKPEDNINRNKFNELLKARYTNEYLFDLATIESTRPDGSRSDFVHEGRRYFAMEEKYTDDGGHLNRIGQRVVAEQLLIFLAKLTES